MAMVFRGHKAAKKGRFRTVDALRPRPEPLREGVAGLKALFHAPISRVGRIEHAILRALGERRGLFRELQRLRSERERALHEAFFEAGYGHGIEARRAVDRETGLPAKYRGQ